MIVIFIRCIDEVRFIFFIFSEEFNKFWDNEWGDISREFIERLFLILLGYYFIEFVGNRYYYF